MGAACSSSRLRPPPPPTSGLPAPAGAAPVTLRVIDGLPQGDAVTFIKLVLFGDRNVGKSSLVVRLTRDAFADGALPSTIGAAYSSFELPAGCGGRVRLQLWDTAGEELYRAMTRSFFRDAACGLVVCDATNRASLEHVKAWLEDFREQCPQALAVLVENKVDAMEGAAAGGTRVAAGEGAATAEALGIRHFGVSAKTGAGVKELFIEVAEQLVEARRVEAAEDNGGGGYH